MTKKIRMIEEDRVKRKEEKEDMVMTVETPRNQSQTSRQSFDRKTSWDSKGRQGQYDRNIKRAPRNQNYLRKNLPSWDQQRTTPLRANFRLGSKQMTQYRTVEGLPICHNCLKVGHYARVCPENGRKEIVDNKRKEETPQKEKPL